MSSRLGEMVQNGTGLRVEVYRGFSWPAFFFGPIWYLVKGMWGIGLLYFLLCCFVVPYLIGLFIVPFIANRQYVEHLGSKGYAMVGRGDHGS